MSQLIWSGKRDDLAIILAMNFIKPEPGIRDITGFLSQCHVEFTTGTAKLMFTPNPMDPTGEPIKIRILRDEILRQLADTSEFGRVTRLDLDSHTAHDINIIANGILHYTWNNITGIIAPNLTTKELASIVDFGTICFSLADNDGMDASYAAFLFAESTSYQYHVWVRNRKLFITGTTIAGQNQLLQRYSSILGEVQHHSPTYKQVSHEDAVAIAFRYGYKSFTAYGNYWVALPDDNVELDVTGVKDDMLEALTCTRDSITGEEISELSIIDIATIVKLGNICLTRQTILDFRYDFFSRVEFTRFVRTGAAWAIYASLGYSVPSNITLNLKQNLKYEDGKYYYTSDSGANIVLAQTPELPDVLYQEFNRQFKKGRYFDSQTFSVFLETGKLLSNEPIYTINIENNQVMGRQLLLK